MQRSVTLQPVCTDDDTFLFELFRTVHEQTFASLELPAEERIKILRLQFNAQQEQYRATYPNADFDLVLRDGVPVGNMYAVRGPDDFVLIDISLLPEQRNSGIGADLVGTLVQEAKTAGKPLHAHVRRDNPAWHLWQRLGFEEVNDDGVYLQIRVPSNRSKQR